MSILSSLLTEYHRAQEILNRLLGIRCESMQKLPLRAKDKFIRCDLKPRPSWRGGGQPNENRDRMDGHLQPFS